MAVTFTPFMGLALPSIISFNTFGNQTAVGTLPQDWALYLNSNLVIFDNHDHSESGKPVLALNLLVTSPFDNQTHGIKNLNYVNLPNVPFPFPANLPALYSASGNLFFSTEVVVNDVPVIRTAQISNLGMLPADVGGFFGDYVVASANANFDGPTNIFTFFGSGAINNATMKALTINANNVFVSGNTIVPPGMQLTKSTLKLENANINYGTAVLTYQPTAIYKVANVVGDTSDYIPNGGGQSNNVPLLSAGGIYSFNTSELATVNFIANANVSGEATGNNTEVITLLFRSANIQRGVYGPNTRSAKNLTVVPAPGAPPLYPGSIYSIISCKAAKRTNSTVNMQTNITDGWVRLYLTLLQMGSGSSLWSSNMQISVANETTSANTLTTDYFLECVVKLLVRIP